MTYLNGISIKDSVNLDAFARLRVSQPIGLHDSKMTYDLNPLIWETTLTGSGSVTHLPNESAARMRCTTASGDKVVRQSRYIQYRPGKSQMVLITGVFGAKKANVRTRAGLFDANNGVFYENDGTDLKVVVRSYTSGSPVDTAVAQSSWNIDKLDGTGASGVTLDPSKGNILFIDAEWLGVGRVRFGWVINGIPIYCHAFNHANSVSTVYATTLSLPVRYEIENTGVAASTTDMLQICSSVQAEGGDVATNGQITACGNGITTIAVTTRRAVLSIRPKATFNSVVNRTRIDPLGFDLYVDASAYYEIIRGGTLGGSPSWTSAGANSAVEFDVAGTTVTGGDVVDSGYITTSGAASKSSTEIDFANHGILPLPLSLDAAGANPILLTIAVTSFTGTANSAATANWVEVR